jgi:hypothetical protein
MSRLSAAFAADDARYAPARPVIRFGDNHGAGGRAPSARMGATSAGFTGADGRSHIQDTRMPIDGSGVPILRTMRLLSEAGYPENAS